MADIAFESTEIIIQTTDTTIYDVIATVGGVMNVEVESTGSNAFARFTVWLKDHQNGEF